ncbi:acetyl/propionyl/methylcrotonyl-CoA carboxylase subunit alpha [Crossiella cryophila]|uniref:Biotin-dependent 3-methylcrotonyl-coenzyme A carboxylase alpha1 subunit n=1 Tax=Crossiella cryophila TaxID=43355 RepID=A0A7W7FUB1_9PSEU|nr:acetyl/propionyl/methylcrotonyl-CoA carboxylase subunit alpha [Crossiella cryophila]MBB4678067.1 acetyl-CoA/propionyl-CoA carboxylase biotin carboxyl carrier protein [Crossiella cryophila]
MFDTVLVANRGEIAVRVIDTLRRMGIRSVAVYSDADAQARHVREADVAVRIGPAAARDSYLSIERIINAARETGAQAVHPGYGFLAENTAFATACAEAGLVFVGPPPAAIEAMGDKIRAKQTVSAAGVPVVPGRSEPGLTDEDLIEAAGEVGFPVLLKPSAGGGGKGMRLVTEYAGLAEAIAGARREASGSFGDDTLLLERFVQRPRHIEIQVLADTHGTVLHLGERECSLQRRHQKIVEEAPSPLLDEETRQKMGAAAAEAARSVGYTGAGTVEFILSADAPDEFFFMEMNTRLQVEHPVTELVTGLDLVEWQLRVAAGEKLEFAQSDIALTGHAVEARIYAEDPSRGFLPTGGTVLVLREPDDRVRVDSALLPGSAVGSDYDPMLAKYIAHGRDRAEAIRRLRDALANSVLLGVTTNIPFLLALLADEDVAAGRLDTGLVERKLDKLTATEVPEKVYAAVALERLLALEPQGSADPWDVPGGWRIGEPAWASWQVETGGREAVEVKIRGRARDAEIVIGDGEPERASASARVAADGAIELTLAHRGRTTRFTAVRSGHTCWLTADGETYQVTETERLAAARHEAPGAAGGPVTSPMPGTVLVVKVAQDETVTAGQPLIIVEAMKMEHTITAPVDGLVSELRVKPGQQVGLDQVLAVVTPQEG